MIALTEDKADSFVAKLQRKGVNVRWDGWKMIFFKADKRALRNPEGRFNTVANEWGFETTVSPNEQGVWLVDYRQTRAAC
jgi:hypothetical protein